MRVIAFFVLILLAQTTYAQDADRYDYDENGNMVSSYTGKDGDNYSFVKYYTNGKKSSSGQYKNGLPNGVWKTWNEEGKLVAVARYKNGEKTGKWLVMNAEDASFYQLSFTRNHLSSAVKKDATGHIIAKR